MKGLTLFIFLLTFIPLVSAQVIPPIEEGVESAIRAIQDVFTPIFEILLDTSSYDDFFFAKILLALLLFFVILGVTRRLTFFRNNRSVAFVVALVISILASRFISEEGFIAGILLPYGTLGIAAVTYLPFLIYFWFVHQASFGGFGRRMAWLLYGLVFIAIWVTRPAGQISSASGWIYGLGLLVVLISFTFDHSIHRYFRTYEIGRFARNARTRTIATLQAEYLDILHVDTREARMRLQEISNQLRNLGSDVP